MKALCLYICTLFCALSGVAQETSWETKDLSELMSWTQDQRVKLVHQEKCRLELKRSYFPIHCFLDKLAINAIYSQQEQRELCLQFLKSSPLAVLKQSWQVHLPPDCRKAYQKALMVKRYRRKDLSSSERSSIIGKRFEKYYEHGVQSPRQPNSVQTDRTSR